MSTKRFNLKQAKQPDKLTQRFSFSGKVRGADVLLRLVEACGYEVVREALEELKPKLVTPPAPRQRKVKTGSASSE